MNLRRNLNITPNPHGKHPVKFHPVHATFCGSNEISDITEHGTYCESPMGYLEYLPTGDGDLAEVHMERVALFTSGTYDRDQLQASNTWHKAFVTLTIDQKQLVLDSGQVRHLAACLIHQANLVDGITAGGAQ